MANNFTQFSFAVSLLDEEQVAWARHAVRFVDAAADEFFSITDETEARQHPLAHLLPDDAWEQEYIGYNAVVDDDGLWIYADESGTPDHVVPLVQAFLVRFQPDGCVGFEWADTCSKPRLDQFGGGAVLITATDATWLSTSSWLQGRVEAHRQSVSSESQEGQ